MKSNVHHWEESEFFDQDMVGLTIARRATTKTCGIDKVPVIAVKKAVEGIVILS